MNLSPELGPLDRLVTLPGDQPALTLGWQAVKWASKYLKQPNGPHAGQRFQFTKSQIRFLLWFYAVDESGQWLYRRAVRRLAKGSGKSPFAALIALVELCAPVRLNLDVFDGTQESIDAVDDFGHPLGCLPVSMPLVQIAATAESQTEHTMRMVRAFAPKGSRVVRDHGLDPGETRYNKAGGGKLHVLTSSASAAEGGEATFIVGDEPEHWKPGNNGPEFASTLADNLAKSGSRMLETCNSWVPGAESVAEKSWESWVLQEEGQTRGESQILYDARVAPPQTVLHDDPKNCERDGYCDHDPEESHRAEIGLTEALDFVYDDCWWANKTAIRERIWDLQSLESDSRRKYLNQPVADEAAWVTPQEWSALTDAERVVTDGEEIVMFFDGSKSRDATALVGCCMSDGHVFELGVWEPDPKHTTEDTVDAAEVDSKIIWAHEKYKVLAFFADVQEWQGFVKVTWPDRYSHQYVIMAAPSGREPASIAWDMRSRAYEFAEACEVTREEILSRRFTHDGSSVIARHVANARDKAHKGRWSISKESPDSPRKIDAAVCVVGARMVRRLVLASPGKPRSNEAYFRR